MWSEAAFLRFTHYVLRGHYTLDCFTEHLCYNFLFMKLVNVHQVCVIRNRDLPQGCGSSK